MLHSQVTLFLDVIEAIVSLQEVTNHELEKLR